MAEQSVARQYQITLSPEERGLPDFAQAELLALRARIALQSDDLMTHRSELERIVRMSDWITARKWASVSLEADGMQTPVSQTCVSKLLPGDALMLGRAFERGEPVVVLLPTIVCLCGSTRFMDIFLEANAAETIAGRIVLSVALPKSEANMDPRLADPELQAELDELHLSKIDLADEVLVLDVDGYLGKSTRKQIGYAIEKGKHIRYWSREQREDSEA